MKLYTSEGKIARGKNPKNAYYYRLGKLTRMKYIPPGERSFYDSNKQD